MYAFSLEGLVVDTNQSQNMDHLFGLWQLRDRFKIYKGLTLQPPSTNRLDIYSNSK